MTADFVLNALLRFNYLPRQRRTFDELPPWLSSDLFKPDIAENLANLPNTRGSNGYDVVEYRATRFNSVSRSFSIPHPKAHAELALSISDNWSSLSHITKNEKSKIRPRQHKDGRIIIMDYEGPRSRTRRLYEASFGRRFAVKTDIANCFPSVYSHAIPWALVGMSHAKSNRGAGLWFNKLDQRVRNSKRNETQGIAIGPATSNVLTETILGQIDQTFEGTYLRRYIDDYTAFFNNEEDCRAFIRRLGEALHRYKLNLNIKKTEIIPLPRPHADSWATTLALSLPVAYPIKSSSVFHYLNLAIDLSKHTPDGSVLKYALKALLNSDLSTQAMTDLVPIAFNLAFHQTALLPSLTKLFDVALPLTENSAGRLNAMTILNAENFRSDGISWCLYYLVKYGLPVSDEAADAVLASRDCIGLILLSETGVATHLDRVRTFAESLDATDYYVLDQYWILLYELFARGQIRNPYSNDNTFPILADNNVRFFKRSN